VFDIMQDMIRKLEDKKADISAVEDRGESVALMEPLLLAFPTALASRWMPGLFPDKPTSNE
jgi:hypothetical protein